MVDGPMVVTCPSPVEGVMSLARTIYDPNDFGGPGCDNATQVFYLENGGVWMDGCLVVVFCSTVRLIW